MPSPFPGMNPYLEGPAIWEDFHANLATKIQAQLAPQIQPAYIVVLTPHVTYEEVAIEKPRLLKPDVAVVQVDDQARRSETLTIAPAPLIGQVALEAPVKSQSLEIREADAGELVTAIEILSPVNKRPGREAYDQYRRKRRDLMRTGVHILEIDLLRGGKRPPLVTPLPDAPYFIFLTRAQLHPAVQIWPLSLQEPVPVVPVPLAETDPDAPLDLNRAIDAIYDEALYHLRIDYTQPPPPPDLPAEETAWLAAYLRETGVRRSGQS